MSQYTIASSGGGGDSFDIVLLQSGEEYGVSFTETSIGNQYVIADVISLVPIYIPVDFSIDQVTFNVQTVASAGKEARIGLYNCDDSGPTTVNRTFGTISVDSLGKKSISDTYTISKGRYFIAIQAEEQFGADQARGPLNYFGPLNDSASSVTKMPRYTALYSGGLIDLTSKTPVSYLNSYFTVITMRAS